MVLTDRAVDPTAAADPLAGPERFTELFEAYHGEIDRYVASRLSVAHADDLAAYTAARLPRTTGVARASRRVARVAGLDNPLAERLRNVAMSLAGRFGPDAVLRQMDPVLSWRP